MVETDGSRTVRNSFSFARNLAGGMAVVAVAALMIGAMPSFADEIKTDTMAADPMKKTDAMATNAMAADPMSADAVKADCMAKAEMQTDAMKKETIRADCAAMPGDAMKADQMAPKQ
jgi:pentapeptide MXKDX repeat protein